MIPQVPKKPIPKRESLPESDLHLDCWSEIRTILKWFLGQQSNVYIGSNIPIYYDKENPSRRVTPDIFVVRGISNHQRAMYKTWEEGGCVPDVIFEVTSNITRYKDSVIKSRLYQKLGVKEYFRYDPREDYLLSGLRGICLGEEGIYYEIRPKPLLSGGVSLPSEVLDLQLHLVQGRLRFFDLKNEQYLQNYTELMAEVERLKAVS